MPGWITGLLVLGEFCLLVALELRRPLRPAAEPKLRRVARNLTVSALGALSLLVAERPLVQPLSEFVHRRELGLVKQLPLPGWLEVALAVSLMDYTLYLWHRLMHRWVWLWRFHLPHHVDLELDASTALQFHFSELVLSVPWRAGQIAPIGVSPLSLSIWQTALMLSILFHHSNVRLPIELEKRLSYFIVTPRMHGIHHSIIHGEQDSNWSSGLTLWDFLHRTLKLNVPQSEITIGVPAYRDESEVRLAEILGMPFRKQRPTWQLPEWRAITRSALGIPAGAACVIDPG
ncbi:MAG TPA: sterol desaturase family protein [Candidatus Binatia bacterium]|nr:sterol desaturase family protein [Candidatus Binatia bacterium]